MTDVFISYAREDKAFARSLFAALEDHRRDAWVDWEGIPPTAEWLVEIETAIDAADTFLFVMSPDSLASEVCGKEVDHAARQNKRLVPVVRRESEGQSVPTALAKLNWIFMRERDDFTAGIDTLIEALDTDLEHVKLHTRYLKRAVDWEHKTFDRSYALRGRDLAAAETWLAESGGKEPQPTSLHNRYILESRQVTTRRQRIVAGAIGAGVLVAMVLGLLALQQRAAKHRNQQRSIANQLVGESRLAREEREDGLEESVQLAAEAMRRLDALGERSLAADQELRRGLALLPPSPTIDKLEIQGETRAAAFSSTGTYLAIATSLGNIVVRDVLAGGTVGSWAMRLEAGDSLRAIAVDEAGARVAIWRYSSSRGDSRLSLWDVSGAVEVAGCDRDGDFSGRSAELGPDGRLWIGGEVWRLADCRESALWDERFVRPLVTLSGDGKRIAASVRQRGDRQRWIEIRDAESGAELARWRHENAIARLWFLDRGRRLAAVGSNSRRLQVWDVESPGRPAAVDLAEPLLAIRGDGRAVVTGKQDSPIAKVRRSATGTETLRLVHSGEVRAAAFSPDGRTLTTLTGQETRRWQLSPARQAADLGPNASRRLVSAEGEHSREDLAASLELEGRQVLAVAACPDESRLAVTAGSISRGGWQAHTELWRMPGGERLASFDLLETLGVGMRGLDDRSVELLECSADGRYLAAPARDAAVVREVATGGLVARLPHPGLHALAFAPGSEYVATAGRGPVRVWQLSTGAEVARLLDVTPVDGLAFSDDGRYLATATEDGVDAFLWQPEHLIDAACGRLERSLTPSEWSLLFPDTTYVATCPLEGRSTEAG